MQVEIAAHIQTEPFSIRRKGHFREGTKIPRSCVNSSRKQQTDQGAIPRICSREQAGSHSQRAEPSSKDCLLPIAWRIWHIVCRIPEFLWTRDWLLFWLRVAIMMLYLFGINVGSVVLGDILVYFVLVHWPLDIEDSYPMRCWDHGLQIWWPNQLRILRDLGWGTFFCMWEQCELLWPEVTGKLQNYPQCFVAPPIKGNVLAGLVSYFG